jgi:uncharacterized protein
MIIIILSCAVPTLVSGQESGPEGRQQMLEDMLERTLQEHPEIDQNTITYIGNFYYRQGIDELTKAKNDEDIRGAIAALELAIMSDNDPARNTLGTLYLYGDGVERNVEYGLNLLLMAAENGFAESQFYLGIWFGEEQRFVDAVNWFRKAADQNYPPAQYHLAMAYFLGTGGLDQDYEEAFQIILPAAESGYAPAQGVLGFLYVSGLGVQQDQAKGIEYMVTSAESGFAPTQQKLGDMYFNGDGIGQDYEEAHRWLLAAALQNVAEAQFTLGTLYFDGLGTEKNGLEAYYWYSLAHLQGLSGVESDMEMVREELTRAETTFIAERIAVWCQKHESLCSN